MTVLIHINILLGFLIYLYILIIPLVIVSIDTNSFTPYNINKFLENCFVKSINSRYFTFAITNKNYFIFLLTIVQSIYFYSDLITFTLFLFNNLGFLVFAIIIFDYYNNTFLLHEIKAYKEYFYIIIQLICLSIVVFNNFNYYGFDNTLGILYLISIILIISLIYINIINKDIKEKYPYIFYALNIYLILSLATILYLVFIGSSTPAGSSNPGPTGNSNPGPSGGSNPGPPGGSNPGPSGGPNPGSSTHSTSNAKIRRRRNLADYLERLYNEEIEKRSVINPRAANLNVKVKDIGIVDNFKKNTSLPATRKTEGFIIDYYREFPDAFLPGMPSNSPLLRLINHLRRNTN